MREFGRINMNETKPKRPSFNLDRTFCDGSRCSKTEACDRYHGKFKEFAEQYPDFVRYREISVADWSDYDGKCRLERKND